MRADAELFKDRYEADVQFIFSHVQHHWHPKDAKGLRQPTKYCQPKGKVKKVRFCKSGFPMHVCHHKDGKLDQSKFRVRVVCKGVAAEMKLKCSGRRNMLGMVLGRRRNRYFSGTSALLAHVFRSNSNVQTNYRLPLNEWTHDRDCKRSTCTSAHNSKRILRIAQNAMKAMTGYFGGYISKKQKVGRFELKKSISALPLLQEKIQQKAYKSASSQLAHVCNRFFSVLESKGILRTAPEEFMLASRYDPSDELAAEFIRTFRHNYFHGVHYLQRFEALKKNVAEFEVTVVLPKGAANATVTDAVSLYGLRGLDPRLRVLSPWFFVQGWKAHRLRPPAAEYAYSKWTHGPITDRSPIAGVDYVVNEAYVAKLEHLVMFPQRIMGTPKSTAQTTYDRFRLCWLLFQRQRPCVPCPERTPLPGKKDTKAMKAKLFSIYLRPWTLVHREATVDVPFLTDLDLPLEDWQQQARGVQENGAALKSPAPEVISTATLLTDALKPKATMRDIRKAWKEYYCERIPPAFAFQVTNFVRACSAKG